MNNEMMSDDEFARLNMQIDRLCKLARQHMALRNQRVRKNTLQPMQGTPDRLLQLAQELEQHGHEEDDEIAAYLRWQAGDV